jgi:hypothetical protein
MLMPTPAQPVGLPFPLLGVTKRGRVQGEAPAMTAKNSDPKNKKTQTAALTIAIKSSAFKAAPPIKPPSMSAWPSS